MALVPKDSGMKTLRAMITKAKHDDGLNMKNLNYDTLYYITRLIESRFNKRQRVSKGLDHTMQIYNGLKIIHQELLIHNKV